MAYSFLGVKGQKSQAEQNICQGEDLAQFLGTWGGRRWSRVVLDKMSRGLSNSIWAALNPLFISRGDVREGPGCPAGLLQREKQFNPSQKLLWSLTNNCGDEEIDSYGAGWKISKTHRQPVVGKGRIRAGIKEFPMTAILICEMHPRAGATNPPTSRGLRLCSFGDHWHLAHGDADSYVVMQYRN